MRKRISRVMISGALSLSLCLSPVVSVMGEEVFVEESTEASGEAVYSESVFSSDDAAYSDSVFSSEEEGYSQDVTASEGENVFEEMFYSEEEGSSDEAYYSDDVYFSEDIYDSEELIGSDDVSAEEAWADNPVPEETGAEEKDVLDEPGAFEEVITDEESYGVITEISLDKEFIAAVKAIPGTANISLSYATSIIKARALYGLLTNKQKGLSDVRTALQKLETAEKKLKEKVNQTVTDAMQVLIDKLPVSIPADAKSAIEKVKKVIEDLTGEQTDLISGIRAKLEEAIADLNKAIKEGNSAVIEKVKASITSLPSEISSGIKESVNAVIQAYNSLTDDQKNLIDDNTKQALEEIVSKLEDLKKQESLDKIAARVVETMMKMLQDGEEISIDDKAAVELVKETFDKLTAEQKALVPEVEEELKLLLKKIEDKEAARALSDSIAKIPEAKAGEGQAAVQKAEKIRTGLTSDQLALVPVGDLALLDRAKEAYKEGRTFAIAGAKYQVLSNGNLAYAGPEDKTITSASVPNQIRKGGLMFKVERISDEAFKNCKNLKWVVIHKNIKIIGKDAFYTTPNLETIKVMSKLFEAGRVMSAFEEAGMNRGIGLTVKTPGGYVATYEKLFKGEGKLNKKALVIAA